MDKSEKITVYTTVFGKKTDKLLEPGCRSKVRFVCFTDQPIQSRRWEIVRCDKKENPIKAARLAKALSHSLIDTEWSLWVDANFKVMVDPSTLFRFGEFVNFRHPDRNNIIEESEVIVRLRYANQHDLKKQIADYRLQGFHTEQNPQRQLSANGVILRRHTDDVIALNCLWAEELSKHTLRDQMSLDFCAWKVGRTLNRWPGHYARNLMFLYKNGRHLRRNRKLSYLERRALERKTAESEDRRRKLAEKIKRKQ